MNVRAASKLVLICLVGTTSRAQAAPRTDVAQCAKAGDCACCTGATYVAIPLMYALRAFDWLISRVMALWRNHGPWARWRSDARSYANTYRQLSKNWDWAVRSLYISALWPLFRTTPSATPLPMTRNFTAPQLLLFRPPPPFGA